MKARETSEYSIKNNNIIPLSITDVDSVKRTVTGMGNVYNYIDSQLDVLMPGAALDSIAKAGPGSTGTAKIKFAFNHDLSQMLPGKITLLEERETTIKGQKVKGLYFEAKLTDNQAGNDLMASYMDEVYDQHSIGFKYTKYKFLDPSAHGNSEAGKEWNEFAQFVLNANQYEEIAKTAYDKRVLKVDEIKLYEISTVAFGANDLSVYLGSKAQSPESLSIRIAQRIDKLTSAVKKGTQSDETLELFQLQAMQLKTVMRELFDDLDIKTFIRSKNNLPENQEVKEETEIKSDVDVFSAEFLSNIASRSSFK